MKIEKSSAIPVDAKKTLGGVRCILCSLFVITPLLAAVGTIESPRANQGSTEKANGLPGAVIVVTSTNDSGPGSLRDALAIASNGDTIDATGVSGTILLTSGELNVDKDIIISGPGANNLAVDGNGQSRVFYINPGKTVAFSGLTISNGYVTNDGGGIYNDSATLTVTNSTLSGNSADSGGGISNGGFQGFGSVTVSNSTLSGNSAVFGGGIVNAGAGDLGGSDVIVTNSTISGNSAGDGGGLYNRGSFHSGATLSVKNSTVSGNSATGNGSGIYNHGERGIWGSVELDSTILNSGSPGGNIFNDAGTITSYGYNLSSDDGGGYLVGPGDQINIDPMLGPLQDNGGPSLTHALLPSSPAVNAGDPSFTPPPFFDQRGPGFDRVVNGRIDIGSFEVQRPTPTPCGGAWEERSPVPYNAGGVFAVSDGTFVYAGGGADLAKSIFYKDLLQYDPLNDTWATLPSSPDYHYHSQGVYFDGRIYIIGGYNENLSATDTTRIYNTGTHTWTTRAPMPHPLAQMATALWDGVIYVAGGNDSAGRVNTLYAYDIANDTWTTLEPMPQAVTLAGFGVIDGKLYIAGGSADVGYLDTLYIYEIATNTWDASTGAHLPQAIARPGSSVFDDGSGRGPRLYLYGGRLPDLTPTNITQIYDPVTNTWDPKGPPMNVPLFSSYGTAVGNNRIVAPGGLDANFVGLIDNEQLINIPCATPTPSPTPTITPTATATPTPTPTARPRATPRPRPTPHPRPSP